jgi:prevent-host-death family protein
MHKVNVHEAKTNLSELLKKVEAGEEVIIARSGKPVARLVPASIVTVKRLLGSAKGLFKVPEDFNDPLPEEVLQQFYK